MHIFLWIIIFSLPPHTLYIISCGYCIDSSSLFYIWPSNIHTSSSFQYQVSAILSAHHHAPCFTLNKPRAEWRRHLWMWWEDDTEVEWTCRKKGRWRLYEATWRRRCLSAGRGNPGRHSVCGQCWKFTPGTSVTERNRWSWDGGELSGICNTTYSEQENRRHRRCCITASKSAWASFSVFFQAVSKNTHCVSYLLSINYLEATHSGLNWLFHVKRQLLLLN